MQYTVSLVCSVHKCYCSEEHASAPKAKCHVMNKVMERTGPWQTGLALPGHMHTGPYQAIMQHNSHNTNGVSAIVYECNLMRVIDFLVSRNIQSCLQYNCTL